MLGEDAAHNVTSHARRAVRLFVDNVDPGQCQDYIEGVAWWGAAGF